MAVVIVATVSGTDSNSYITLADFETYLLARVANTTVDAATDDQKNRALVQSTRVFDGFAVWGGSKTVTLQALAHPRTGLYDRDGVALSSTAIAQMVLDAICELTILFLLSDRQAEADQKGIKSLAVGSIDVEFDKYDIKRMIPTYIWNLVSNLGVRISGNATFEIGRG